MPVAGKYEHPPGIQSYYLGYLIPSNPKMVYKGDLPPTELLLPGPCHISTHLSGTREACDPPSKLPMPTHSGTHVEVERGLARVVDGAGSLADDGLVRSKRTGVWVAYT